MRPDRLVPPWLAAGLLVAAGLALALFGWLGWRGAGAPAPDAHIPTLDGPPPIPPLELHPATTPIRVVLRDVDLTTATGTRIELERAEVVGAPGPGGDPLVRVRRLVLDRPVITAPVATSGDGGGPGLGELDIPRIVVDTLRVRNGVARERAAAASGYGRWRYDLRDIDLRLTDVVIGGDGAERARLRLALNGRYEGRPLAVRGVEADVRRTPERLSFTARGRVNRSTASAGGTVGSGGRLDVSVASDSFDFEDFRPVLPDLPSGSGTFEGRIVRAAGETRLDIERATLRSEGATVEAVGDLVLGPDIPRARHLDVRFDGVTAEQAARYGLDVPLPGRYSGTLRVRTDPADAAPAPEGSGPPMRVRADLARRHEGRTSRVSADGDVAPGPPATVDLRVEASPIVLDSTFEARLAVRGPLDSLAVDGEVALVRTDGAGPARPVVAEVDVRVLGATGDGAAAEGVVELAVDPSLLHPTEDDGVTRHSSPPPPPAAPIRAVVAGRAALAAGTVDARVRLDSLPLALLPMPDAVAEPEGFAAGTLTVSGSFDAPAIGGDLRVAGAGARLTGPGARLDDVSGRIRLANGAIEVTELTGRVGGGAVRVAGRVVPGPVAGLDIAGATGGPRTVDLRVVADSAQLLRDSLADVSVTGGVTVTGTVDAPRVAGRVRPSGWVLEDYFAPSPGLDLDDPPYAELAARAPWTSRGRLGGPAGGGTSGRPAGATGTITVDVDHAIAILDEDSELRGSGTLEVVLDDGVGIRGVVALEEGFYAQYGTRFEVYGGAFVFDGSGTRPRVALRSDYLDRAPLGESNEAERMPERFPPVRMFGYSDGESTLENATRFTLLPNSQIDLARLVLLGVQSEPVTGWRYPVFWTPAAGGEPFGSRMAANAIPLLWSYVADVAYDFVSIRKAYLTTDLLSVGEEYPGRLVVTPSLRGSLVLNDRTELRAGQALTGVLPRLELVYRAGRFQIDAFTAPRYYPAPALGGVWPGYRSRQGTGLGIRWSREF